MTSHEEEVLSSLAVAERTCPNDDGWLTPMYCGGFNGSHHSGTLVRLARKGLVERRKRHAIYCYFDRVYNGKKVTRCCCKGSCVYRITDAGRTALETSRASRAV